MQRTERRPPRRNTCTVRESLRVRPMQSLCSLSWPKDSTRPSICKIFRQLFFRPPPSQFAKKLPTEGPVLEATASRSGEGVSSVRILFRSGVGLASRWQVRSADKLVAIVMAGHRVQLEEHGVKPTQPFRKLLWCFCRLAALSSDRKGFIENARVRPQTDVVRRGWYPPPSGQPS